MNKFGHHFKDTHFLKSVTLFHGLDHGQTCPFHKHPHWELVYVQKGEGYMRGEWGKSSYRSGQIAVIPPRAAHFNFSQGRGDQYCLLAQGVEMSRIGNALFDANRELTQLFGEMEKELVEKKPYFESILENKSMEVAYHLLRLREKVGGNKSPWAMIKKYLDQNYHLPLTTRELARRFEIPYDPFRHGFKENFGLAPVQYLLRKRIQEAKKRMLFSEESLKETARAVGIPNPYYFSRLFREMTGQTATDFRRGCESR